MADFFTKIWNSVTTWFIDERGWAAILGAVLVIVLGLLLIKIILSVVRRIVKKSRMGGLAGNFLVLIIKIVLLIIYIIAIFRVLGIDTTSMIAILTTSTLAISLALQETLSNFASGMILVSNRYFDEGDYVNVSGVEGSVVNIRLFSTTLKTPDNKIITIPNSSVASGNIINYSHEATRRLDLEFGVAYGTDLEFAKKVMTDELEKHPKVLHDAGYTVRLNQQQDSAISFVCRCYVNTADYWPVYFDLMENIHNRFNKENIEIPYNKLDVYVNNVDKEVK